MKRLNKISLGMALLFASASTLAYDGTVNFNGEIVDNACAVSGTTGNSMIVLMDAVNKSSFSSGRGVVAATTPFTLTLTNCPTTNARVRFEGTQADGYPDALAISGGAKGVGIQLYNQDMSKLPLYTASNYYQLQEENEANELNFYASYVATGAAIEPGPANASANFTISYN